jgi:hypothetical protein
MTSSASIHAAEPQENGGTSEASGPRLEDVSEINIPWGLVLQTIKNKGAYPALVLALIAMNVDWSWVQGVC